MEQEFTPDFLKKIQMVIAEEINRKGFITRSELENYLLRQDKEHYDRLEKSVDGIADRLETTVKAQIEALSAWFRESLNAQADSNDRNREDIKDIKSTISRQSDILNLLTGSVSDMKRDLYGDEKDGRNTLFALLKCINEEIAVLKKNDQRRTNIENSIIGVARFFADKWAGRVFLLILGATGAAAIGPGLREFVAAILRILGIEV